MDNLLIQVAIGLVLIYLALSILLMKVQESLHGGVLRGRVKNMHLLMQEATGRDPDLKKRILANGLVFSLSDSDEPSTVGRLFRRPTGPSAVPPDLFAKALLMELNPSRQLPSSEPLPPLAFMDNLLKNVQDRSTKSEYLRALRGLIPSPNTGWPQFEMAIATWFADIGDRADGWYKRRSSKVGLWLAIAMCAILNVDTANIINTLGADNELRQSLGSIADLVLQQREAESKVKPAAPLTDPALEPSVRAIARLADANNRITEAYAKDKAITGFGYYVVDASDACKDVPLPTSVDSKELKKISNSDTWVAILPAIRTPLEMAINRVDRDASKAPDDLRAAYKCLSHLSSWVQAATTASRNVDTRRLMVEAAQALEDSKSAVLSILRSNQAQGSMRRLFRMDPDAFRRCARVATTNESNMQDCVLREQDLLNRLPIGHTGNNWRQQFCQVETFGDNSPDDASYAVPKSTSVSAEEPAASTASSNPAASSGSAAPATSATPAPSPASVPSRSAQPLKKLAVAAKDLTQSSWLQSLCGTVILVPQPRLNLSGMTLTFAPSGLGIWLVGVLISALFISLGAPVLFDTLEKWVHLRNAGRVRDATESALKGGGTMALPMLAAVEDRTAAPTPVSAGGTLPAVEGANPGFEEQLTPREVQAVKQRLGIQPSTGGFDEDTRKEIRKFTNGSDHLTLKTYFDLMGRSPVQAGQLVGAIPGTVAQLRQPFAQAPALAENLNVKLDFLGRVPTTESRFSDELRALTVLYRFKTETDQTHAATVFKIADAHPEQLDTADVDLINKILGVSSVVQPRFPNAPWMDVAIGELGQVEKNGSSRATSNPRVCEYLDAVGPKLGNLGDTTAWCAAFVTWVLKHPYSTGSKAVAPVTASPPSNGWVTLSNGFNIPDQVPEGAKNWIRWARPAAVAGTTTQTGGSPAPLPGDVVVVDNGQGGHHVGFVFEVNAVSGEFWMLAGNQRSGTRVCLSPWRLSSIR